jgi:hypothetical protein
VWREAVFKPGRPKDQAPKPLNWKETLGPEYCGFPVLLEGSGKMKIVDLPNGDKLFHYPDLRITLTNEENGKQVTLVEGGTIRATYLKGGDLSLVTTGQTVLTNPKIGILALNGRFTFVQDRDGNFSQPKGNGKRIDVCDQLA